MILIDIFYHGREGKTGGRGRSLWKMLDVWYSTVSMLGKRPFQKNQPLQKANFCSFAEKGRSINPQDPSPSCVPDAHLIQ